MDSIAAGELPQADGISWKYKNSIEFPKTDHELSGHGRALTHPRLRWHGGIEGQIGFILRIWHRKQCTNNNVIYHF